ncbi:dynactin subunit 1 isoform X2 [Coccinella septempunctata]|uniref:dynactin subunit 1 isoform X2 n=1 Tax=Coccinella septempunctata TaxID=41139 RepID=UPI001D093FA9|nr:dynactin subunit 1 isoform X2 [Coccinella septempunctata]
MSDYLKIGRKVEISGKDVQGVIAYYGQTEFAPGKWIGVILNEPKGKNNGIVRGREYFKCEENHGMFVRAQQIIPLDDEGKALETTSGIARPKARQSIVGTKAKPTPSRISLASSRQSLSGSRQSLSGSRQSLSGSRQSLSGSRSHLASPVAEKNSEIGESGNQSSKRASFIETGFVETLKPQFTPGQALTSAPTPVSSMEEKITIMQIQQECENRNQQIKDLQEKLETLKMKRQEDKEKLKDFDKLKIQLDHLLEFKSKIMESQASLQRELQRAKQEAKEAVEARENHADEVGDLAETLEMALLDKEMAEEKCETLQLELTVCKEKLEEVTLDLEILKNEMQEKASGIKTAVDDEMTSYEVKQIQQQNLRLKETLVKMRDLSAHDKHEYQKLMKDMEQKNSEITELSKTKEKLSARVESLEQQIADLQEQVDAALGAEEMVVLLGEQKLTLEEKVTALEEEVMELEALQDMNNQLLEGSNEIEADLREELEMARAQTRQALRDRDAAIETIADRETTIGKFRELVQKLRDQSINLQDRLEKESSKPVSGLPEILDFKKMFSENKAHTKAIDLELRRVDIEQLQQHVKYLTSYMPESFMSRGGDYDAILVLLLIPRLITKTEILLGQVKDKFPVVEKITRPAILKEHAIEQYAFRCRVAFYIYALQTILHQYYYCLNICKPEVLLKIGGSFPEIAVQEKVVDGYVELVKRDQLDENVTVEALEKCVTYFNTLFPIVLGVDAKINHTRLLSDTVKCLYNACDGFNTDALVVRNLIETANVGDIGLLAQYIITTCEQLQQQLKLVKRRLPTDPNVSQLGFTREVFENLYQCYQQSGKILKTLQDIVKTSVQVMTSSTEFEKGLTQDKLKDIAINASDKIYKQDDLGPVQSIKNSLTFVVTEITQIAQFLQDNEFDISTSSRCPEKATPPVVLRAETVKKELEQTKTLTSRLENKESDLKELRKVLKEKQEQLSEMVIRKELAEKKLGNVNKDYELTIEKLQRKLEEANNNYKKKEKEFEETLDHLQRDIDSLENEKGEMREKFKLFTKKAQLETMSKSISGSQLSSLQSSTGPILPAVVRDSPLLIQEIHNLKKLYNTEKNQRFELSNNKWRDMLESMKPLPSFSTKPDKITDELMKEGENLKQEILLNLAKPKFPSVYKYKANNMAQAWNKHFAEEHSKWLDLERRAQNFQSRVAENILKKKEGGRIKADFATFPTNEMTKAYHEETPVKLGFIKIPATNIKENKTRGMEKLEVDFFNVQCLMAELMGMSSNITHDNPIFST